MIKSRKAFIENIFILFLLGLIYITQYGMSGQLVKFSYSYVALILFVAGFVGYLIYKHKHGENIINRNLITIEVILLLFYIGTICFLPKDNYNQYITHNYEFVVSDTIPNKIISLEYFLLLLCFIYISWVFLRNNEYFNFDLKVFYYAILTYLAFLIAYSLIKEQDIYQQYLTASNVFGKPIVSITGNGNEFAQLLLIGIIAATLDDVKKPHFYNTIISLVIFVFVCFTQSLTSFILSVILIISQFVLSIVWYSKSHDKYKVLNLVLYPLLLSLIVATIVIVLSTNAIPFISSISNTWIYEILNKDYLSLTKRIFIFEDCFNLLLSSSRTFIFGFGHRTTYFLNAQYGDTFSSHNAFIQTWMDGGVVVLIAYLAVYVIIFIEIAKLYKAKKWHSATLFLISIICIFLYSLMESAYKFSLNNAYIFFLLLVIAPLLKEFRIGHDLLSRLIKK